MHAIHHSLSLVSAMLVGTLIVSASQGQDYNRTTEGIRFEIVGPVKVRLSGSSTIHDWNCVGDQIELFSRLALTRSDFRLAVDTAWAKQLPVPVSFHGDAGIDEPPLTVKIPIDSLECSRSRMQRDLREAVRYEQHPKISYKLHAIRDVNRSPKNGETLDMEVTGLLTVAGISRLVEHGVKITRLDPDTFQGSGTLDLKMTWFDMTPPSALFGLLRAHDAFKVEFTFQSRVHEPEHSGGITSH